MPPAKTLDLDIAILGGGFAGVYCAQRLARTLGRASATARAGLISEENYMVFQPMLPEVAGSSISPRHITNPIRLLCKGVDVYRASVDAIDPEQKELVVRPGPFSNSMTVRFRHLVVALGAVVDVSRVPGMAEHAYFMRNVGDAMKLRATVLARFEEANLVRDRARRKRLLTFVVVGGGYSGVETAGQILDLFQGINQYYRNVGPDDFRVVLIHSRDTLLQTLSRELGDYAKGCLDKRGLDIILNTRVRALTANTVYLDDGASIDTNTVISTVGNAPHPRVLELCEKAGIETERGRLPTDARLRSPRYEWLWAAGDCAAVPHPAEPGETCPATAQFAMRQGRLLGANVAAALRGRELRAFDFKGLGELASIGHRTAVAEILGFKFHGFFAWWLWRTIYLGKLPGLERKLRVVIDWTLDLFFPRDINLLNPRYSETLRQFHLEPGDVLYHQNEPAFSFYVVQQGRMRIIDPRNGDQLVKEVGPGEFFGESSLLDKQIWRFTAAAAEPTEVIALGSDEFKAVLAGSHSMRRLLQRSARQYRSEEEVARMKKNLPPEILEQSAKDRMASEVTTLRPDMPVREALGVFNRDRHSFYPVVDEHGRVEGAVFRGDFYDFVQEHGIPLDRAIREIGVTDLTRVAPDASVDQCLTLMIRTGSNKLLVVGADHTLQGILSIRDLLATVADQSP